MALISCLVVVEEAGDELPREPRSKAPEPRCKECVMSRGLFLGTLGTLLFAGPSLGVSWAQNKQPPVPPFLEGSEITLEMSYSCPSNTACSFACPSGVGSGGPGAAGAAGGQGAAAGGSGAAGPEAGGLGAVGGFFGADHVTKLTIWEQFSSAIEMLPFCFMIFQREREQTPAVSVLTLD